MPMPPADDAIAFRPAAEVRTTLERWHADGFSWAPVLGRWPLAAPGAESWGIFSYEEDALVGQCLLCLQSARRTLGCALWVAPAFRGRGLATQAGRLLLDWALAGEFTRVEAAHPMTETAAARLAERLGMLPEGVQRSAFLTASGPVDLAHWGKLRTDI